MTKMILTLVGLSGLYLFLEKTGTLHANGSTPLIIASCFIVLIISTLLYEA